LKPPPREVYKKPPKSLTVRTPIMTPEKKSQNKGPLWGRKNETDFTLGRNWDRVE